MLVFSSIETMKQKLISVQDKTTVLISVQDKTTVLISVQDKTTVLISVQDKTTVNQSQFKAGDYFYKLSPVLLRQPHMSF